MYLQGILVIVLKPPLFVLMKFLVSCCLFLQYIYIYGLPTGVCNLPTSVCSLPTGACKMSGFVDGGSIFVAFHGCLDF